MHDSDYYVCSGQISLDELLEQGFDVADKNDFGTRDNELVPNEDDE